MEPEEVDSQGVRDEHDDHRDVECGQGAEESETTVVDDALIADHDVGLVHHTQSAQRAAD